MKQMILVLALAAMGALVVACGSDDNAETQTPTKAVATTTATAAPTTPAPSQSGNTVDVGVQEWSINPATNTAPAGDVTFNIKNIGPEEEHEFVIIKTDLTPANLPLLQDGSVDEGGAGLTSPGEVEGIGAGATTSKTFNLTPGHYIFICNIVDQNAGVQQAHFKEGMHTEFTVQ